jgi:hypothetical protein
MSSGVTERSLAIAGMAGKYIFEAKAENVAAMETIAIIRVFCFEVKMLCGIAGDAEKVCPPFSSSVFFFSILAIKRGLYLGLNVEVMRLK